MPYHNETIVNIGNLLNHNHSFFSQICSSKGKDLRFIISQILNSLPEDLRHHWRLRLHSFDNGIFFQGLAELLSLHSLQQQDWTPLKIEKQMGSILLEHESGSFARLVCVSFLSERDLDEEERLSQLLQEKINQLGLKKKIALIYRQPLYNTDSVLKAFSCFARWLKTKTKTYQTEYYRDDSNWIECKILPSSPFTEENTVQIVQQALCSDHVLEQIDQTADKALERVRSYQNQELPVILSLIGSQEFHVSLNSWRFFLYGPTAEANQRYYRHDADQMRGWMHDPFRTFLSSVLRIECLFDCSKQIQFRFFENPWSEFSDQLPKHSSPSLILLKKENFDPIFQENIAK